MNPMAAASFFEPLGDGRYRSTEHTVGPWGPDSQHGGPPSALLVRAIERESPSWPTTVARVSVDILGPVPIAEVTVRSRVLRPGRSVELVEATLDVEERTVMRAQAWRIRAAELELPPLPESHDDPSVDPVPPFPAEEAPLRPGWGGGYLHAMEWRFAGGDWAEAGPATIWSRMRYPLLPGEEPTGLQRVLAVADSGNGISNVLPLGDWLFINTELTVHVAAVPSGEWICLDARTHLDQHGFGLASSRLFDRERLVARGAQTLYVGPR
jgi:hypothetical protein